MDNKTSCATTGTMVMACSGGADVGALADKLARKIAENENTKMFCLAGISAHISGMIGSVKSALKVIVIDGCPVGCAKKVMGHLELNAHCINLADYGFQKGKTNITDVDLEKLIKKTGV